MTGDPIFIPRSPLLVGREPLSQPMPSRLLTEDNEYLLTEDGYFISLEGDGQ